MTQSRLLLRPGVHVLRRSADRLQVGLAPDRAVVLPDTEATRTTVAALTSPGAACPEEYDVRTIDLLTTAGLLVEAGTLLPLLPTGPAPARGPTGPAPARTPHPGVPRADTAALAASDGDAVARLVSARSGATARVTPTGGPGATPVATALAAMLTGAGLACASPPAGRQAAAASVTGSAASTVPARSARAARAGARPTDAAIEVLVSVGEPTRELLDGWVRDGTPHLLLRLVEGHAVVGPFVRPGQTACLRCLDAHHTDVDPAWPLLVAQYAAAVGRDREDAVPEPVDSVLATLAAAWAAREVLSAAEGRPPATTATTVRLDPHLTRIETQDWPRHPECGCAGL